FVAMSESTTTLIAGAVLAGWYLVLRYLARDPVAHRGAVLAGTVAASVTVIAMGVVYLPVVTEGLGKDQTLTGRTEIWEGVVWAIGERPLTGYGAGGAWINVAADPART